MRKLAKHFPGHIYLTGRNESAAASLISEIKVEYPDVELTFLKIDLSSLRSVKDGVVNGFKHDRLDILINNAGIAIKPPALSVDGYEVQFATNYLGHAMLTKQLLPYLLKAAEGPDSDVRIVNLSSYAYAAHRAIKGGISLSELEKGSTFSRILFGSMIRYGQSKLANILFASELARRFPQITSTSLHPGVVRTAMTAEFTGFTKIFTALTIRLGLMKMLQPEQGVLNQLWLAAGAKKEELRNGGFYAPVGVDSTDELSATAKDGALAKRLWEWTEDILSKH